MARIEEMQAEIDTLRATIAEQPQFGTQFFRRPGEKWNKPEPLSEPLDIQALAAGVYDSYSYYDEYRDVYRINDYL
jgi:hypothetical protein